MRTGWVAASVVATLLALPATALAAGPTAIGVADDGTSYAGFASGAVARYGVDSGTSLGAWSTPVADANGSLGPIVAIDVAPDGATANGGNVWILDANRRVQEFSRTGTFLRGFRLDACDGSNDPEPGRKGGLDVTADSVYVAHPCGDRVQRFALSAVPGSGTGSPAPAATATVFAPHGIAAQGSATAPVATRFLYVAQAQSSVVRQFDLTTLTLAGDAPGGHSGRYDDVFVDVTGTLFVAEQNDVDDYDDRIFQYAFDGSEIRWIGGPGTTPGLLNDAMAFDVFPQAGVAPGNVFVADTGNERVQRMTDEGFTFWAVAAPDPGAPPAPPGEPPPGEGGDGGDGALPAGPGGSLGAEGAPGVTIAGGARFTNTPQVTLTVREPAGSTGVEISNSAGFEQPDTRSLSSSLSYEWTLDERPSDTVPRSVHVRFPGSGSDASYSDEITLDRRDPLVGSAALSRKRGGPNKRSRWVLRVAADDEVSGLAELQTARRAGGEYDSRPFEARTTLRKAKNARFVRVADVAGNVTAPIRVNRTD